MTLRTIPITALLAAAMLAPAFSVADDTPTPTATPAPHREHGRRPAARDDKGYTGNGTPEDKARWEREHANDNNGYNGRRNNNGRDTNAQGTVNANGVNGARDGRNGWQQPQLSGDALKGDKDIIGTLKRAGEFTIFLKAIDKGDMTDKFNKNTYTVFAPTDAAFSQIPLTSFDKLMANRDAIRDVVRRHVVEGKLTAADLAKKPALKSLEDETVTVETNGNKIRVNKAMVTQADIPSTNGEIHVVNTFFTRDSDFTRVNKTDKSKKSSDSSSSSSSTDSTTTTAPKKTGLAGLFGSLFGGSSTATPTPTPAP